MRPTIGWPNDSGREVQRYDSLSDSGSWFLKSWAGEEGEKGSCETESPCSKEQWTRQVRPSSIFTQKHPLIGLDLPV